MNAQQIRTAKTGDKLRFKRGFINHGCHATFLRIVPDGKDGPKAPTIEYSFNGQIKQTSHDHFTK
jgi:hypothetical protein